MNELFAHAVRIVPEVVYVTDRQAPGEPPRPRLIWYVRFNEAIVGAGHATPSAAWSAFCDLFAHVLAQVTS